ncbi:MAG: hypothetical protein MET45_11175 [Nostoc sp. LLA-1]|nr:hypothetical protein [Cyanocohniella sp. LLY]
MDALPITKNIVSYSIQVQKLTQALESKADRIDPSMEVDQLRHTARRYM